MTRDQGPGSFVPASAPHIAKNFLINVFGPNDWLRAHVCVVPGDPSKAEGWGGWGGGPAGILVPRMTWTTNNYFCVSTFKGRQRRQQDFEKLWCLVVDDVGPKVDAGFTELLLGPPTWIVETSPGNCQWGYKLATPITDASEAKDLIHRVRVALTGEDGIDPGMEGVTRLMRIPCGVNLKASLRQPGKPPWQVKNISDSMSENQNLLGQGMLASLKKSVVPGQAAKVLPQSRPTPGGVHETPPGERADILDADDGERADPDDDVELRAFRKLGRIIDGPRDTAMGWGYDVRCPWVDEHTDRAESGTVYVPGAGKFKCHHGHCLDRTMEDLRGKLDELLRADGHGNGLIDEEFEIVETNDVPAPPQGTIPKPGQDSKTLERNFFERYVFLEARNRFYDLRDDHEVVASNLDTLYSERLRDVLPVVPTPGGKKQHRKTPSRWFMEDRHGRRIADIVCYPGQPRVFPDNPSRPREKLMLNLWKPLARPLKAAPADEVDAKAIDPWLEVFWHVIGWDTDDDRRLGNLILDWMALVLGDPALKAGWHVMLMGQPGVGKDTLILPVAEMLGDWAHAISSQQLGSDFTEWTGKRLVQVSETKQNTRGTQTAHDQMAVLKRIFDNTQKWLIVNPKYAPKHRARNVCMGWFTSNESAPLRIEKGDRRFVIIDRSETALLSRDKYLRVHQWLTSPSSSITGIDRVGEFLLRRWETMDAARRQALMGTAPATADKEALLERLSDPIEDWMRSAIALDPSDSLAFPDIVHARYVHSRLVAALKNGNEGLPSGVFVPKPQVIATYLKAVGAVVLNGGAQVKVNGSPFVLWAVRDAGTHDARPPWDMARAFLKGTKQSLL